MQKEPFSASVESFRRLLEQAPIPIVVFDMDGKISYYNPAGRVVFAINEELADKLVDEYVFFEDELLESLGCMPYVEKAYKGEACSFPPVPASFVPGGEDTWLSTSLFPLTDADGQMTNVVAIHKDVTDVMQAQRGLVESEQRFREMADNIREVFWLFDVKSQKVLYTSPAFEQIWGRSIGELYEKHDLWAKCIHPDDRQDAAVSFQEIVDSGGGDVREYRIVRPDGDVRWISDRGWSITGADGDVEHVVGIAEDITEIKAAIARQEDLEAQVRHAQKLESLGVMAGGIAHDFNNLLVAVLMNIEMAKEDISKNHPAHISLVDAKSALLKAADLSRQMLAYTGKGSYEFYNLNLNGVVEEMSKLLHSSVSRRLRFEQRLSPNLAQIRGDASQIQQVVLNLVTNASEAVGDESGTITIATGEVDCDVGHPIISYLDQAGARCVFLEVTDTGCGMDADTLEKMFDPFFTSKFTGRGLGLAVVLGIVRGHRGAVQVESRPGHGSTVRVMFPVSAEPASHSRTVEEPTAAWRGTGTVLVVDDEESVRSSARRLLERLSFDVLTVRGGREALSVFHDNVDDIVCVLLDMTMPDMDGFDTFVELRRLKGAIPVIVSSGFTHVDMTRRFGEDQPSAFLQKPYQTAQLSALLANVIG